MDSNVNYIPQVDYTSRDYVAIKDDLLALIPQYTPAWTSRDPADLGMTIVEMFSYLGDVLNFYIDRAANEGFLATASQRDSVLQIAAMLGYIPDMPAAATVTLSFSNSSGSSATIPAKTQIASSTVVSGSRSQVIFETDFALTVGAGTTGVTVTATQGYTVTNEVIGTSSGSPNQMFKLATSGVIGGSITAISGGTSYFYTSNLLDHNQYDAVFTTFNDAYGNTYLVFGDGVNGKVPSTGISITATYRVGVGAGGNVSANTLTNYISSGMPSGITVTNTSAAVGGAAEESTDSIRINAPRALQSLTRAISLKDYASLALQVSGVAKAVADSPSSATVVLYISPTGDPGVSGGIPTAAFAALSTSVVNYFTDKTAPNITLTISPPTYAPVDIDMTVHVLPQYQQSYVLGNVNSAITELLAIDNSFFADIIPAQYIINAVSAIPGVDYVTLDYLRRLSSLQSFSINNYSRTGYTVTVTTTATHSFTVGQTVKVTASIAATDGTWVVSAVTSTTVSYVTTTTGTIGSTAISPTGTIKAIAVETVTCAVNEIPSLGTLTTTGVGGI